MEGFPQSPESGEIVKKEEVIQAYKKFVEQGIKNPGDLDLDDPEVQKANELFNKWREQEDASSEGDEELSYRNNLVQTMLYVDVGFTDRGYLEEVLREWLVSDAQNAEKQRDNPERVKTRQDIVSAMKKIRGILGQSDIES